MIVGARASNGLKVIIFSSRNIMIAIKTLGLIAGVFALGLVTTKPLFYKMASKPFEYRKNNDVKPKKNVVTNKRLSSFKTQILLSTSRFSFLINFGLFFLINLLFLIFIISP